MLVEQLRKQWRDRPAAGPIEPVMNFKTAGLVLGADTVLAPATPSDAALIQLEGEQDRLLALLSAAYGRPVNGAVLGHLRHATKRWGEGDLARASVHLALTGLGRLADPRGAAERLFLADGLMKAGVAADVIVSAFVSHDAEGRTAKAYNPAQPRQPAGSPTGGEWISALEVAVAGWLTATRAGMKPVLATALVSGGRAASRAGPKLVGILGDASEATVTWIGSLDAAAVAASAGVAVGGFGLAFIPSPMGLRAQGRVAGMPGLSYLWNRDETHLSLTYKGPDGVAHSTVAEIGDGDQFRDRQGRVIGRVLPNGVVVIDAAAAVKAIALSTTKPSLCPAPEPDKYGQGPTGTARDYENVVKRFINPDNPTPNALAYYLVNPTTGKPVTYDDCQHETGILVEAKGGWFAEAWTFKGFMQWNVNDQLLSQSLNQVQASQGRPIEWFFPNESAAAYARKLFDDNKGGRERITILVLPWPGVDK